MAGKDHGPQYLTDDHVKTDQQMVAVHVISGHLSHASVTEMAGQAEADTHCSERVSSSQRPSTFIMHRQS